MSGQTPDAADRTSSRRDGVRSTLLFGYVVVLTMVIGIGAWAATTSLAGAVIAVGTVVVESSVKKVQHQTGGIVGEILVHESQRVQAREVLVRLDQTNTRANLHIISKQLDRTLARKARLEAEYAGLPEPVFPPTLEGRRSEPGLAELMRAERSLFESRRKALESERAQLRTRGVQLARQIEGLIAQKSAMEESATLVSGDLVGMENLYKQQLIGMERVSEVRLEAVRMRGEAGRLLAAIAETEGKVVETELQILQLEEERRREVLSELRELEGQEIELSERKLVAENQLARDSIRAPQAGRVQELSVHTVGGIIHPGETVMLIVPDADHLVVDARVAPTSIDEIHLDQEVSIRFPAFEASTTPQCRGRVRRISADQISDTERQQSYFVVRISMEGRESCLSGDRRLQPGMPAEVYIATGQRSVWSYILKPLSDQAARAFRES